MACSELRGSRAGSNSENEHGVHKDDAARGGMGPVPERERKHIPQCGTTGDQKKRKWKVASHTHRYVMDPRKTKQET